MTNTDILSVFRKRQSAKTKFIHFCYVDETSLEVIPIFENLIFVLTLFQSKEVDNILEGKERFNKLLAFLNKDYLFSEYLHSYPHPAPKGELLKIALALSHLKKDFSAFTPHIDIDLIIKCIIHYVNTHVRPLTELEKLKVIILTSDYSHEGEVFQKFTTLKDLNIKQLSELLLFCQLLPQTLNEKILKECSQFYDHFRGVYFGAPIEEKFLANDPVQHLFPYFFQNEKKLAVEKMKLYFPLIYTSFSKNKIDDEKHKANDWLYCCNEKLSYAARTTKQDSACMFFRTYWLENQTLVSLTGEGSPFFEKSIVDEQTITFHFLFNEEFVEDRKDAFEVQFFLLRSPHLKLFVDGCKATTFQIDDSVTIIGNNLKARLQFSMEGGEGDFHGHIHYANRPSQSVKDPFQSFDWKIGLRTLRRCSACRVTATLTFLR